MCYCTLKSVFIKRRARDILPQVQWLIFITIEKLFKALFCFEDDTEAVEVEKGSVLKQKLDICLVTRLLVIQSLLYIYISVDYPLFLHWLLLLLTYW